MRGEIVKTVSGSDLIPKLASLYGLSVFETPIGYKYIADRMLTTPVLIGGKNREVSVMVVTFPNGMLYYQLYTFWKRWWNRAKI